MAFNTVIMSVICTSAYGYGMKLMRKSVPYYSYIKGNVITDDLTIIWDSEDTQLDDSQIL